MLLRKGLIIWVLVMENMMENAPKPKRHMKVFQEGLSLHVHYFKLVIGVHEECKSFTPTLQEDAHKHATNGNGKQEDVESSRVIEFIASIQRRATTSSNSPPQEGGNGEC